MKNKEYISFIKMIEYIDKALKYTKNYTYEQFCNDEKTIDTTVFAISQIGELVKNISKETMRKYSNIEWNMIKGLRNRIVHDYEEEYMVCFRKWFRTIERRYTKDYWRW